MADLCTKTIDNYLGMLDYVCKLLQHDPSFVSKTTHNKQAVASLITLASVSNSTHNSAQIVPNVTKGRVLSMTEKLSLSEVPRKRIIGTCLITSIFLAKALREIANNKSMDANQKKRKYTRVVTSYVVGILFSLYGSLAGQSLIKNQAVGRLVGSIVGTIAGRVIGGTTAEIIYSVFH
jgi:hypothetical protein